jgi:hypothetical protein
MSSPRVTIGLPVFNGERYLAETLESILAQDFEDFELVVADNASTDRTRDIVRRFAERDHRIRLVTSDENRGAAWNFSRLVAQARGEYFKWASGDDLVRPQYLSRCVQVLDDDAGVVLAYARTSLIDADGGWLRDHDDGMHLPQEQAWSRLRDFAMNRWLCNACFGVMRTDVMRSTGLIGPTVSSDVTFLAEMALAGKIHEVPDRLFLRRVVDTSCGLGELSRAEVSAWFDPRRRVSRTPPMLRVFRDIERVIWRTRAPLADRARTSAQFTYAWCKRQAGIQWWRTRRRLRREPAQSWAAVAEDRADLAGSDDDSRVSLTPLGDEP